MPSTLTFAGTPNSSRQSPGCATRTAIGSGCRCVDASCAARVSRLRNASPALISTSRSGTRSTRCARNYSNAWPNCWCRFLARCTNSGCGLTEAVAFRMRAPVLPTSTASPQSWRRRIPARHLQVPILRILKHCAPASWSQPARWNCGATNGAKCCPTAKSGGWPARPSLSAKLMGPRCGTGTSTT